MVIFREPVVSKLGLTMRLRRISGSETSPGVTAGEQEREDGRFLDCPPTTEEPTPEEEECPCTGDEAPSSFSPNKKY